MNTNNRNRPAPWGETLLALGPNLLFPVLYVFAAWMAIYLENLNNPVFGFGLLSAITGALLIALITGWVQNFPRWVFPYWGFVLLISLYFYSFSGTVFGQPFSGDIRVWMPLGFVVLTGLLWTRNFQPLRSLAHSIWEDWTLLSFAFYGTLPLFSFAAFDEMHNEELVRIVVMFILGVGTIFYMRMQNAWHRFASLVGGFSASWLTLMIYLSWYWNGRQEYWMPKPGTWVETFNWTSQYGVMLMLILVAPVLIEFLRLALTATRLRPTPQKPNGG